ncbi:hypothetical protein LXL04_016667 [Taraxacum kok-saghyz]
MDHVIDLSGISEPPNSQQNENPSSSTSESEYSLSTSVSEYTLSSAPNTPMATRENATIFMNSGNWISYKLFSAATQITAAIVVLSMYRHEHPGALQLTWLIGYVSGCDVTIPLLIWRFYYLNETSNEAPFHDHDRSHFRFAMAAVFTLSSDARTSALDTIALC